jgi:hypothetical protein
MTRELSYLRRLEPEAVFVIREVAAEFERPVLPAGVERLEALLGERGLL